MRQPTIKPVDSERDFNLAELFFSTTDRRGIIEAGNAVFARIAGYAMDELIGSPHNIIRHPDVPRAVFQLLWSHVLGGRTIAAYVKNLASDGRYYWVVALVIPIGDRFLSVRFKPTSPLFAVVRGLYAEMLQIEAATVAEGGDGAASMAAAAARLQSALAELGYADYDAFMRAALRDELKNRDTLLSAQRIVPVPTLPATGGDPAIRAIFENSQVAYDRLCGLFTQLDSYVALNAKLTKTSATVIDLTRVFRFISLNTSVKAAGLGQQGAGLGVVAAYLGEASSDVSTIVSGLTTHIGTTSEKLAAVIFDLAGARLQIEMILDFCRELIVGIPADRPAEQSVADATRRQMIADLKQAFTFTIRNAVTALGTFEAELGCLRSASGDLRKIMLSLEFMQLGGMVEAQRLDQGSTFGVIFTEVRKQLELTKDELSEINDIIETMTGLVEDAPRIASFLAEAEAGMERQIAILA